ncbi:MAG TPA: hypothetical protein ENK05_11530 [Gammaproteobacteria bacterium]|nr:hypothetical protein [Gammaproteobacteria bacterium]
MSRERWPALVLALLLAGCAGPTPVPEDRFYQLQIDPPVQALPRPALEAGLEVEPVSADPLRSGRAVVYRSTARPLELHRYHYRFWADQPPRMVGQLLVAYLRDSGVARSVSDGRHGNATAYRLRSRLLHFEQLTGAEGNAVDVALEASLFTSRPERLVWTHRYRRRVNAAGTDMHAVAAAMEVALKGIFEAVVEDLENSPGATVAGVASPRS